MCCLSTRELGEAREGAGALDRRREQALGGTEEKTEAQAGALDSRRERSLGAEEEKTEAQGGRLDTEGTEEVQCVW